MFVPKLIWNSIFWNYKGKDQVSVGVVAVDVDHASSESCGSVFPLAIGNCKENRYFRPEIISWPNINFITSNSCEQWWQQHNLQLTDNNNGTNFGDVHDNYNSKPLKLIKNTFKETRMMTLKLSPCILDTNGRCLKLSYLRLSLHYSLSFLLFLLFTWRQELPKLIRRLNSEKNAIKEKGITIDGKLYRIKFVGESKSANIIYDLV